MKRNIWNLDMANGNKEKNEGKVKKGNNEKPRDYKNTRIIRNPNEYKSR